MVGSGIRSGFNRFIQGIRAFLGRGRKAQLDAELQFHIEMSAQSIQASSGVSTEEARRRALIDFGGVEQAREETWRQRPSYFVETLLQDTRYALRGFRRNLGFTITVIATLALGIGTTTAVFSVVDRILFRALPYAHGDRLVSVGLTAPIIPVEFMLGGSYYVWRDNQKPFEAFTSETGVSACDLTERNPARLSCASVEASFLPTLGISPLLGRNFLPEEDRPHGPKTALISYALWQSHYGSDPKILNRLIEIDGVQTRVVGVLPKEFEMPTMEPADIVVPQALDEAGERREAPDSVMYAFARLKPGVSAAQASAALDPVFQYSLSLAPPAFRKEVHLRVRSLRDRQMQDAYLTAWVLLGAVLAVLLIACANVASLMMARGAARERELAVRSALGASRGRLLRQTLTESMLLSLTAAAAGWALAELLLHLFVAMAPAAIPFLDKAQLDLRVAAFTMLLACLCGGVFGMLASVQKPRDLAMVTRSTGSTSHSWLRRVMVVAQIAVSIVLLASSTLLVRSFWNLQNQSLGIRTRSVLTASISLGRQKYDTNQKQMQFFLQAESALRRLPGITVVAVSDSLPPSGWHRESVLNVMAVSGSSREKSGTGGMVAWRWVTPEYFRALEIPIEQGQNFTEEERTSTQHLLILSKLLADRLFPGQNPIGRQIRPSPNDPYYTVVGVAANVKNAGLTGSDEPEYYRLRRNLPEDWTQSSAQSSTLILETSLTPQVLTPWVRSEIAHIDPILPVEIETLDQRVNKLADAPRFEAALLGFFAFTGLAMAVIGLYGLTAYIAQRRTQEIGVRMALGADRADILRLIATEGLRLILLGGALGLASAIGVTQLLKSLLFNIGPHDPLTFAAVALLLVLVALAATLVPARAAMRVDPVVALRCE
ncbi:ABC transporter permease [Acidicapsa acidisoli]|uniref:ABC transporter permease n=1 Tax=Acidicapsa acidisoli TaxID=1615681 RepID=UPI0021DF5F8B|nr:ABC transporter permease [Acidicapsa acidisoli]